ncbi:hypothetical protein VTJ04DRAFT_5015 [Mycothermus thermophilus]|uniref:uncharacterized protein n=1 Tax=Humicola insolens TaxID=85995 RepID=UPI0037425E22
MGGEKGWEADCDGIKSIQPSIPYHQSDLIRSDLVLALVHSHHPHPSFRTCLAMFALAVSSPPTLVEQSSE